MAHSSLNTETGEPLRRGALVSDRAGDVWRRGNTRWTCTAEVDGRRVQQVARLPWGALQRIYGPVLIEDLNDRLRSH